MVTADHDDTSTRHRRYFHRTPTALTLDAVQSRNPSETSCLQQFGQLNCPKSLRLAIRRSISSRARSGVSAQLDRCDFHGFLTVTHPDRSILYGDVQFHRTLGERREGLAVICGHLPYREISDTSN